MFIIDNQLTFLRLIEIFPIAAMNQLLNIENMIVENVDEVIERQEQEQEDINDYHVFIHYLKNFRLYNRLILISFVFFLIYHILSLLVKL